MVSPHKRSLGQSPVTGPKKKRRLEMEQVPQQPPAPQMDVEKEVAEEEPMDMMEVDANAAPAAAPNVSLSPEERQLIADMSEDPECRPGWHKYYRIQRKKKKAWKERKEERMHEERMNSCKRIR